jgi:hypothetical protein
MDSARQGRRRTPRTTDSRHDLPIAPNLLARNFTAERPDQVWLERDDIRLSRQGILNRRRIRFNMLAGLEASMGWRNPTQLICASVSSKR